MDAATTLSPTIQSYCLTSLILRQMFDSISPVSREMHRDRETTCSGEVHRQPQR